MKTIAENGVDIACGIRDMDGKRVLRGAIGALKYFADRLGVDAEK